MVGTCRFWGFAALGCVLPAIAIVGSAWGQAVKGQSRDLGIQFEVKGGETWCKRDVAVELTAARGDVFKPDTLPFVQMLGRIRAIVIDQCPTVDRISFDGHAENKPAMSIEMTRLTRWRRVIEIDSRTRRPLCPSRESAATECRTRAEAYRFIHDVMRGEGFVDVELTTALDEQDAAHVVWVSGNVVGKMTIKEPSELAGRFTSSGPLAQAMLLGLIEQCRRDGALHEGIWSETGPNRSDLAMRGFSCRPRSDTPSSHAIIVMTREARFYVFALFTRGDDSEVVKRAARGLVHAIENAR